MDFLSKYSLKPHEIKVQYLDEEHVFHAKSISYNLAFQLKQSYAENIIQLAIIKYCLCNEDGTMIFAEDFDLGELGDQMGFELITLLSDAIADLSKPAKRAENVKKKQDN
ncbi:hypothetical protein [Aeromonas sp. AE23HZ002T15]